jgi:hypothetical protein
MLQRTRSAGIGSGIALATTLLFAAAGASLAVAGGNECRPDLRKTGQCTNARGPNSAPTISGVPPTQVTAGQTYSFTPTASDPEGKTLAFSIVNRPPWASFSTSTGRLSGTPSSSAVGEYIEITIKVSDGKLTSELAPFSITVNEANRAPTISGTPPTAAREGQAYEFMPTATDADGDLLTFSITNRPAWATFSTSTGTLKGTPGTGTVGTYDDIVIRVSDGSKSGSLPAFSIGVQQASMGSATLSWQAPTQRSDGTALTNLAGYRIRYGTASSSYPNQVQIANPGVTTYTIGNLPPGTYYFVATAYDTDGRESEFSGVVSKTIS